MKDDIITGISDFYETNILSRIIQMWEHPVDLVFFFDILIVYPTLTIIKAAKMPAVIFTKILLPECFFLFFRHFIPSLYTHNTNIVYHILFFL